MILIEPAIATVLTECFTIARQGWKASGFPIIIVGTTCDVEQIPTGVLGGFKEEISLEVSFRKSDRIELFVWLTCFTYRLQENQND